ncbi:MAG TPA: hypothetical protein VF221_10285 [Chloroflexota bacterium]
MRRFVPGILVIAVGLLVTAVPARAAGSTAHQHAVNWSQHDSAVYVVSTLNLIRSHGGRTLSSALMQKYGVTHFDVYGDLESSDLYFIELRKDDGSSFATLAYQMGWQKPMSLSPALDRFHVRRAPYAVSSEYHTDSKQLIGSFTSTLPS